MGTCKLAIYASGSGSNAEAIVRYMLAHPEAGVQVPLIVTNNPAAGVVARAKRLGVPLELVDAKGADADAQLRILRAYGVQVVALAGYLRQVPLPVIQAYPRRILNIHPALLPNFGGRGMYGIKVHQAVLDAGATETGITIHYVDEEYDRGDILFQATMAVPPGATPDALQAALHHLEHEHYPRVLAQVCQQLGGQLG